MTQTNNDRLSVLNRAARFLAVLMLLLAPVRAATASDSSPQAKPKAESPREIQAKRAEQFIRDLGNDVISMLQQEDEVSQEKIEAELREILNEKFALKSIGRFALGRYWRVATPEQRTEYLELFEEMIMDIYSERFSNYSGEDFKIKGSSINDETDTIVHTVVRLPNSENVTVDWRVRTKNGQTKIVDVIVEGVSMLITQRSDFASVIQRGGGNVEALLTKLRKKNSDNGGTQK